MKSPDLRYSEKLTVAEQQIAARDELDIEAAALDCLGSDDDFTIQCLGEYKAALRMIDSLKIEGRYEAERARLSTHWQPVPMPSMSEERLRVLSVLGNFTAGLRSPDPEQRARFQQLKEMIGKKTPAETWPILACLEVAKRPKGRPGASPPWRNVASYLDAMRLSVAAGATIPQAARDAADSEGRPTRENRAGYFERLYRQRAALRE